MDRTEQTNYPVWRRRCIECAFLGLNTPDGIYCKFKGLTFIAKNKPAFRCHKFVPYKTQGEKQ